VRARPRNCLLTRTPLAASAELFATAERHGDRALECGNPLRDLARFVARSGSIFRRARGLARSPPLFASGLLQRLPTAAHRCAGRRKWIVDPVGSRVGQRRNGDGVVNGNRWVTPAVRTPARSHAVVIDVGWRDRVERSGLTIASVPPGERAGAAGAGQEECHHNAGEMWAKHGWLPAGAANPQHQQWHAGV